MRLVFLVPHNCPFCMCCSNKQAGPLKRFGSGPVRLKAGTNKWETVDELDMASASADLPVSYHSLPHTFNDGPAALFHIPHVYHVLAYWVTEICRSCVLGAGG